MKDLVDSIELGESQQKRFTGSRPKVWLQNEFVRVGLAEILSTYIMMVRGTRCVTFYDSTAAPCHNNMAL